MNDQPNCPFCNSKFGSTSEFMWGCTDSNCPEQPRYHDPVGRPDYVKEFWEDTIQNAEEVKVQKIQELAVLEYMVKKYYE